MISKEDFKKMMELIDLKGVWEYFSEGYNNSNDEKLFAIEGAIIKAEEDFSNYFEYLQEQYGDPFSDEYGDDSEHDEEDDEDEIEEDEDGE